MEKNITRYWVENEPVVSQCAGCKKARDGYCSMYMQTSAQWTRVGGCAGRTHNLSVEKEDTRKVNPLKASKRSMEVKV